MAEQSPVTTFFFTDIVAGAAYARRWTDKLLVGAGLKYVREDLGSDVGGPVTDAFLFDLGSIYYLGYGSVRIAVALTNFGPQLQPSGQWVSPNTGEVRSYDGFDPPMLFRYGVAFEPVESAEQRLTTSLEFDQPADNALLMKAGVEWTWRRQFSLRTGYNFGGDDLQYSAGAGVHVAMGQSSADIDYAYTHATFLEAVHRVSLGLKF